MASTAKPISIVIADQHEFVRRGVACELHKHRILGEAGNGRDAVRLTLQYHPQIVILDIPMPRMSGILAAHEIRAKARGTRVIILTAEMASFHIDDALKAEVHGYVLKSQPGNMLSQAVELVAHGDVYFCPLVVSHVRRTYKRDHRQEGDRNGLSGREREVVQMISEDLASKQIAGELKLSPRTVEHHRDKISRKSGQNSAVAITRWAIREGYTYV